MDGHPFRFKKSAHSPKLLLLLLLSLMPALFLYAACATVLPEAGEAEVAAQPGHAAAETGDTTGDNFLWVNLERKEPTEAAPRVGFLLPPFILMDLKGNEIGPGHFCGEDLLVVFWQAGCPDCENTLSLLQELHVWDELLTVLAVNVENEENLVREFIQSKGFTFPVLLDRDGDLFHNYELHLFPTTVAVNGHREIIFIKTGTILKDELDRIRELLQRWELKPLIK